jgi:hypothetical protein
MHFYGLNLLAVLAASVATMVVGFIWYSPILFARPWMIAMGYNPDDKEALQKMQKEAGPMYGMAFIATLVSSLMLAMVLTRLGASDAIRGLKIAFGVWLGFVATVQFTNTLFGKKPMKLFLIDTGYQLVCYLAMGVIIALWR